MPDILIRGVEAPHNDIKKISIYPNGDVEFWSSATEITVLRGAAHELPPHGDLIDRDAVIEDLRKDDTYQNWAFRQMLGKQPVVVPAERSE